MDKMKKRKLLTYLLCASMIMANVLPARSVFASEWKQDEAQNEDDDLEIQTNEESVDYENPQTESDTQQETDTMSEETNTETQEENQNETVERDTITEENTKEESSEEEGSSQVETENDIEEIGTDGENETADGETETTISDESLEEEIALLGTGDVTSGSYGNIVWSVDANGKLTIEGTGDYSAGGKAPWAGDARTGKGGNITSAEVRVTGITSTSGMFSDLENLTSVDLSGLDTSLVTDMSSMFEGCLRLTSIDMSKCDTSKVTNMSHMFDYCWHITDINFNSCNTGQLTNMSRMFYYCSDLENLDLSMFDTKKVTDMSEMFSKCKKIKNLNLNNFDTSSVINMYAMFYECNSLVNLDINYFSTGNVTNMSRMFWNCSSLKSLEVSNFDTRLASIDNMFAGCSSLTELDLSNFYTENKADISGMFADCSSLTSLNLKNFNTKNVQNMELLFYNCSSLESIDISSFDTSNVVNMKDMFYGCGKLQSLDLSNFVMSNVITGETKAGDYRVEDMLSGCDSLGTIYTPCNLSQNIGIKLPGAATDVWYKEDGTQLTELPQGLDYSIIIKKNEIPSRATENYTLNYLEKTLTIGDKFILIVLNEEGKQYTNEITWNSSDSKIATVSAKGEVSGIAEGTAIIAATISDGTTLQCKVNVEGDEKQEETLYIEAIPDQIYTGKAIVPQLKIYYNKMLLTKGIDYTISYKNNVKAGSAVATIKGKGNLAGSLSKIFDIVLSGKLNATASGKLKQVLQST